MAVPGAELRRGPGELAEEDAQGAVAEAYARLREALGAPFVPTVFRMLGRHEAFLVAGVDAVLARLDRDRLEELAVETRELAGSGARELPGPPLRAGAQAAEVDDLLRRYNIVNPRGIVFAQALRGETDRPTARVMREPLPPPFPDLVEDVRACHGDFTVPGLWRELAGNYPTVARDAWRLIRPLAGAEKFEAARTAVVDHARRAGAGITAPDPAALGLDAAARAEVERVLDWFTAGIPTLLVEIEILRARLTAG